MEASALQHASRLPSLPGRSPLLRLQSDERLIALTRRGNPHAFEALVQRYQARLHAFCRHMLGSTEDAEDVLQEVFAAAYNAILGDERSINVRPWLYRIARNRCLNHLRRPVAAGQDSMDVFERDGGTSTADTVHKREEFRQIVRDVQDLPETQRTALLLREIDALSYDQIAQAMDTTVPSVKSLLVRARVSLAEAAEARLLSCEEVRVELGEVAEGLARTSPPVRRHLKACERCRLFRTELRRSNRALAAVYPIGPLVAAKVFFSKALGGAAGGSSATGGSGAGAGAASGAGVAGAGATAGGATATAGSTAGGLLGLGAGSIATKAAAGFAAAALVTAGAAEVRQVTAPSYSHRNGSASSTSHANALADRPPLTPPAFPAQPKPTSNASAAKGPASKAAPKDTAAAATTPTPVAAKPTTSAATTSSPTPSSPPPSTPPPSSPSPSSQNPTPAPQPASQPPSNQPEGTGQSQQDSSTVTLAPSGSGAGTSSDSGSGAGPATGSPSGQVTSSPSAPAPDATTSGPPAGP